MSLLHAFVVGGGHPISRNCLPLEDGSNNAGSIKLKTNCSVVLGERGDIRYSIYAGNFGNAFAINAGTGLITVKSKLDRETRYKFV